LAANLLNQVIGGQVDAIHFPASGRRRMVVVLPLPEGPTTSPILHL